MAEPRQGAQPHATSARSGLTVLEILLIVALVLTVVCFLFCRSRGPKPISPAAACANKLRTLGKAVDAYRTDFAQFYPVAWHIGGATVRQDLANVAYYRFALLECSDPTFSHRVAPGDITRHSGDALAARKEKYERAFAFWKCPVRGWTDDYFAPSILFQMPGNPHAPAPRHVSHSDVVAGMPAAERPLLAGVNASFPNPEADHGKDPGHEHEMRAGFSIVSESDLDVFVGAGPSLRVGAAPATSRFDFRHDGAMNTLFVDGHVDLIPETDTARVQALHDRWNHLEPKATR